MRCSEVGCSNTAPDHKWGRIRAQADGWFEQKNGQVWCPNHLPGWYAKWKAQTKR